MRLETRVLLLVLVLGLLTGLLPGAEGQYQDDGGRNPYPPTGSDDGGGGGGGHRRVHRAGRARRSEGQPTASVITDMNTNEETTTPAEDRLKCETDDHCSPFTNSVCNVTTKVCECPSTLTVYIPTNKFCGAPALLNTTCEYTQQCTENDKHALCENRQCVCSKDFEFRYFQSNYLKCATQGSPTGPKMEPAMIGVLAGMALMFVIICVVLRLFSKARFRENRSIFNTPNPRLMNASLFKDRRRGSSVSATSNAPATGPASAPSAPGSATSAPSAALKSQSPSKDSKDNETTVAIETVD
ncbi:uncharacterized protein LOC143021457 isoform X3 [Oratosquilla oratoria]|uniref:uncharacterized protein LOC143021457 isoform X3 n=1 Tax=Oratosquilla oratoria TaxID=337810 RepID=UPI003F76BB82